MEILGVAPQLNESIILDPSRLHGGRIYSTWMFLGSLPNISQTKPRDHIL